MQKSKKPDIEYVYKEISQEELDRIFFKIFDLIFSKGDNIVSEKNKNLPRVDGKALSVRRPVMASQGSD